ncbi:MAG: transglutaminase family protein [Chthoniobacter sp.]|nr:transglutaminase family protein [Chthoniobacter sp.]
MSQTTPEITIRCGFEFTYEAVEQTPMILVVEPRLDSSQKLLGEEFGVSPTLTIGEYKDVHGNIVRRFALPAGSTTVRHDALVAVSVQPENFGAVDEPVPLAELPPELLRYILPSRYCDSDRLMDFAFEKFGQVPQGLQRVQAICDWLHHHIEYRYGAGSPFTSASEVIAQGFGVCRDFAHTAVALSRCFNIPTRYATGYLPDVAFRDNGSPMDFHAYFQVYVGHRWQTFDARFNVSRLGRIDIACGLDAVDGAFSTLFGAARLAWFRVWAYQIDPAEVRLGDPIDLSKRLCGTPQLRFPPGGENR